MIKRTCLYLLCFLILHDSHAQEIPAVKLKQANKLVDDFEKQPSAPLSQLSTAISLLTPYVSQKEPAKLLLKAYSNYWNRLGGEGKWEEALKQAEACNRLSNFKQVDLGSRANFYYDMGYIHDMLGNPLQTVEWYERSLVLYQQDPSRDNNALAENYNNLALAYEKIGRADRSIDYLKKATMLWRAHAYKDLSVNTTGLGNLISAYESYGDARSALQWLDTLNAYVRAFSISPLKEVWNSFSVEDRWNREDFILLTQVRVYAAAFMPAQLDSCIRIFDRRYATPRNTYRENNLAYYISALEMAGWQYKKLKQFTRATELYAKARSLATSDFFRMKGEANMGILFYDMGDHEKAMPYAAKSLQAYEFPIESTSMYGLLALNAELNQLKGNDQRADSLLKAIFARQLKVKPAEINFHQLTIGSFRQYINHTQIVVLLKSGNRFFTRFQQYKKRTDLTQAGHFYQLAAQLFNMYYLKDSYNPVIDELNKQISHRLLSVQLAMNAKGSQLEENLSLLENNYSQHLWKKFLSRHAENLQIPPSLIYQRNSLVLEQHDLENASQGTQRNQQQYDSVKQALKKVDQQLNGISTSFNQFNDNSISIPAIRKQLKNGQLILRYMVTDTLVYAVGIGKDELLLHSLGSVAKMKTLVATAINAMRNPLVKTDQPAAVLYSKLVQPFAVAVKKAKQLILIPDDFLNYLPFEALLNEKGQPLVQQLPVSYAYSLKLWQLQQAGGSHGSALVAFAPSYPLLSSNAGEAVRTSRNGMIALPGTRPETESIIGLYSGRLFSETQASRNNFIATLGKYNIYHLAMHAVADEYDPDRSNLVFSNNEPLYFSQLYGLNFPADMVVLSACNTGVGALQHGEGLMSLSRALVYSGVSASVYSLWEVPDRETAQLMVLFYEQLNRGLDKDEALAKAKQVFIRDNPSRAHPFFWAGFVVNGNTAAIQANNTLPYYLAGAGLVVLLTAGFVYRLKRRKRSL